MVQINKHCSSTAITHRLREMSPGAAVFRHSCR